ncbi:hypothetical protein KUTeg_004784 [Tegillarca granosa]|uniref:RING-type domain-containing protein n=1 Tax=Tegillarca granosa TaxID=220873 RepID=A0ABQ9FHV3_TEGGR|nr:hypothetical protein KUTeg_004784 [Tegillarca granosa]
MAEGGEIELPSSLEKGAEENKIEMDCTGVPTGCGVAEAPGCNDGTYDEDVNLQRFLQKAQSDRMYELRQIQLGERPVTKTNHKDKIDSFFSKRLEARAASQGKENVPVNVDNVEEHRPDRIVVEIQGLVQQQRVSNVLSTQFRRHLENIIRGSISTVTRNSPRPSQTPSPRASPTPRPTPAPRRSVRQEPGAPVPGVDFTQRSRSNSDSSIRSSLSNNSSLTTSERLDHARPLTSSEIREIHREEIVQEISELVHRRLVSTSLEGEFRNVLELTIRDHVDASGTDGERVQQFVQNLQQTYPHVRNDFSNLGIPNQPQQFDNWDNISVTSVSATALPYTQSNLYLSREIKSGVEEHLGEGTSVKSRPVNDTHCIICLDNHSDCVLYQCGHMCVCFTCGRNLLTRGSKCPVCRAPIKDVIRAYKSNEL